MAKLGEERAGTYQLGEDATGGGGGATFSISLGEVSALKRVLRKISPDNAVPAFGDVKFSEFKFGGGEPLTADMPAPFPSFVVHKLTPERFSLIDFVKRRFPDSFVSPFPSFAVTKPQTETIGILDIIQTVSSQIPMPPTKPFFHVVTPRTEVSATTENQFKNTKTALSQVLSVIDEFASGTPQASFSVALNEVRVIATSITFGNVGRRVMIERIGFPHSVSKKPTHSFSEVIGIIEEFARTGDGSIVLEELIEFRYGVIKLTQSQFRKVIIDSLGVVDEFNRTYTGTRTFSGLITVVENADSAVTKALSPTISVFDSQLKETNKNLNNIITIHDNQQLGVAKELDSVVAVVENVSLSAGKVLSLSEIVSITEEFASNLALVVVKFAEVVASVDSISLQPSKPVSQTVGIIEETTNTLSGLRIVSEVVSLVEDTNTAFDTQISLEQTVASLEEFNRILSGILPLSEIVGVTDQFTRTTNFFKRKVINEVVGMAVTFNSIGTHIRDFAEVHSISEEKSLGPGKEITENISVVDSFNRVLDGILSLSETVVIRTGLMI